MDRDVVRTASGPALPLVVAAGIVVLDQLTKCLVRSSLVLHERRSMIDGVVALVHSRNPGIGFSMFAEDPWPYQRAVLSALSVLLAGALVYSLHLLPSRPLAPRVALALILGGALGNLVDRLRLGYVTDFVRLGWRGHLWPDFNLADSAISVGAVLFILASFRRSPSDAAGPQG